MARYNHSFGVSFNDNDGGVSWFADPTTAYDIKRHYQIFGKWRTRWIFFKRFWKALTWFENYANIGKPKAWVINAEIPE